MPKNITMTDVEAYLSALEKESEGPVVRKLYSDIQQAKLLTVHDTLSDEFQIVSEMESVVWKYAQRRIERILEGKE